MKIEIASILFVLCFVTVGCEEEDTSKFERIYFNSFEKDIDTVGWYGGNEFNSDTPPLGGNRSLYISGGCSMPHAYYQLGPFDEDFYLTIRCWGKDLERGGGVGLVVEDPYLSAIGLRIDDSSWKYYTTDSVLYCPTGEKIRITLSSGGIVSSAMLIDMIEILKIN